MRIGAEWIYSKEKWADVPNEPDWLGVGYITAELGGISPARLGRISPGSALAGLPGPTVARRSSPGRRAVIALVVLALYLVALWAMTAKPG